MFSKYNKLFNFAKFNFSSLIRIKDINELSKYKIGDKVVINGWVNNIRAIGKVVFLVINDGNNIIQAKTSNDLDSIKFDELKKLQLESVVEITGDIQNRPNENINDTVFGNIEIILNDLKIINPSKILPFYVFYYNLRKILKLLMKIHN